MIYTTVLAGKGAKVLQGTTNFVADVSGWKLDIKAGNVDVTCFATGNDLAWKSFLATIKEWSGSLDVAGVDMTDTNGQLALFNLIGGAVTDMHFHLDSTHYLHGNALITGMSPSATVDGAVGGGFTFQGSGSLLYA